MSYDRLAVSMGGAAVPASISKWEKGEVVPSADKLGSLAKALGVDISYFFN